MREKPDSPDSLLTLPVVLGVIVVVGGVAALAVSVLFVYRAHLVSVETQRMQARLLAKQAQTEQAAREVASQAAIQDEVVGAEGALDERTEADESLFEQQGTRRTSLSSVDLLKRGQRLRAQRPIHWDQAEIVDILEDQKVRVRWLSGAPGEEIIAAELVQSELPPAQ